MTILVDHGLRLLPVGVKDYLVRMAMPRLVERDRGRRELVARRTYMFVAAVEREVREADHRLHGVLDSEDVRLAITDLRSRGAQLAALLRHDLVGVDALLAFIDSVQDLGTGGIKAATTPDEVADAASRAIDHLEGYLHSHDQIVASADSGGIVPRPDPAEVRKLASNRTTGEVASWRKVRGQMLVEIPGVARPGGQTRVA